MLNTLEIYSAIFKIFLLGFLGAFFVKIRWLNKDALDFLTNFLVKVTVPSLIFSVFIKESQIFKVYNLKVFLSVNILIAGLGLLLGIISLPFIKNKNIYREYLLLITFQNCGYLPMNLSLFLFSPQLHLKFLSYVFMYLLGFNFLMWSLGSFFMSRDKFNLKHLFNMPFLSVLFSFLLIKSNLYKFIPKTILEVASILGKITFPLSMIVLGAILFKREKFQLGNLKALSILCLTKLLILPLIVFFILIFVKIDTFLKLFIFIQSMMPSAVSLSIIAMWQKGAEDFVAEGIFLTTFLSILTIPFWLNIFKIYVING